MDITINIWSVLGAAVGGFIIGFLWYGPLFGKQWMKLSGVTKESMKSNSMKPGTAMLFGFLTMIVTAYVLAHFAGIVSVAGVAGAFSLALWVWLGFFVTTILGTVLWEGKSVNLYIFNIAYHFVVLFVMALILTLWK